MRDKGRRYEGRELRKKQHGGNEESIRRNQRKGEKQKGINEVEYSSSIIANGRK